MGLDAAVITNAALSIAEVEGVEADPKAVLEDAFLLAMAFTDEAAYASAIANTRRALQRLVAKSVTPAQLKNNHSGWHSFHYQHKVAQGARADMRIIFKPTGDGIRLRAFGHRNMPKDFYERIASTR